jgi:hypothetical protein
MSEVLQGEPVRKQTEKRKMIPTTKSLEAVETLLSPGAEPADSPPKQPSSSLSVESSSASSNSASETEAAPQPPAPPPKQKRAAENTLKSQRQQRSSSKKVVCKYANTIARPVGAGKPAPRHRVYHESIELYDERSKQVKLTIARGSTVTVWSVHNREQRYVVWAIWIPNNGYLATLDLMPEGELDTNCMKPTGSTQVLSVVSTGDAPQEANEWVEEAVKKPTHKPAKAPAKPAPKRSKTAGRGGSKASAPAGAALDRDADDIVVRVAANGRAQAAELGHQLQEHVASMSEHMVEQVVLRLSNKYDGQIKNLQDQNTALLNAIRETAVAAATGRSASH